MSHDPFNRANKDIILLTEYDQLDHPSRVHTKQANHLWDRIMQQDLIGCVLMHPDLNCIGATMHPCDDLWLNKSMFHKAWLEAAIVKNIGGRVYILDADRAMYQLISKNGMPSEVVNMGYVTESNENRYYRYFKKSAGKYFEVSL